MSLSKNISLTIKDYSITLSGDLKFYVNDSLDLIFTINKYGINNANALSSSLIFDLTELTAYLLIENPNLVDSIEATSITDDTIVFRFTKKYTSIPGTGKMQIRLVDNDGCEIKLPPFTYQIQNTINELLDIGDEDEPMLITDSGAILTEDGRVLTIPEYKNGSLTTISVSDLDVASEISYSDYLIVNSTNGTKKVLVSMVKCSEEQIQAIGRISELETKIQELEKKIEGMTTGGDSLITENDMVDYLGTTRQSLKEVNDSNIEYILRGINKSQYEGYSIISSNTYQKQITDAKLKGVSKFINRSNNELFDSYQEGESLDIVGSSNILIKTCNAPRIFGKGGRL